MTLLPVGRRVFGLEHEEIAATFSNLCPLPYAAREIRGSTTSASKEGRDGIGTDTLRQCQIPTRPKGADHSRLGNGTFLSKKSGALFASSEEARELSLAHAQTGESHPPRTGVLGRRLVIA